jgi:uncharacterized protein
MKAVYIIFLLLFLVGCESKEEAQKSQNSLENIMIDNAYVVLDHAKVMQEYRAFNQHLLDSFDIDFRTITTTSDENIDLFANREFNRLQQESRSSSGKAILMVINTAKDKVRLEVSMALEGVYTDAFISYIEREGFVPYFRNNTISDAIYMAAELISDRAYDAQVGKAFMPPMQSKSIGAGAKTKAYIGKKKREEKRGTNVLVSKGDSPIKVLQKYLDALKAYNTNPNLDIYTDTTRTFFSSHTVTKINQDNEIRFLTPCMQSKKIKYASDGIHAVVMNDPVEERKCTPHFFKKEQGAWKLDIATMAQILRFNAPMQWHFDKKERLKGEAKYYAFAFDGYGLDRNGYPYVPKTIKDKQARWGFRCGQWYHPKDEENVKREPKKYIRCGIVQIWRGSPAEIRLGLSVQDYIYGVGEGENTIENVTYAQFMAYMQNVPSGKIATVKVRHQHGNLLVKRGVAP